MSIRKSIAALAAVVSFSCLAADDAAKLDDLVVTANRVAVPLTEVTSSVTVITRADIERLQARDMADLLRSIPGVTVAQNGGRGQATTVFLRGNESRHTLVLINGHRAGTVELPAFSFEYLPVDNIERIEIVQGARSSLYGSQAFGGVINIITRSDTQTRLTLKRGNRNTAQISGRTGFDNEHFSLGLDAGEESTDGYDIGNPFFPPPFFFPAAFNTDNDGFRSRRFGAQASAPLMRGAELSLNSLHNEGTTEFDDASNTFNLDQHTAAFRWEFLTGSTVLLDAGIARDRRVLDQAINSGFASDSQRNTASAQFVEQYKSGSSFLFGFDFAEDRYRQQGATQTKRTSRAVFTNIRPKFGNLILEVGGRFETDDAYGDITTGQLGLRYALTQSLDVFAHGGSAFRAPTFQERFGAPSFNLANPGLKPEQNRSYEAGLAWAHQDIRVEASGFYSRIRDLIVYDLGPNMTFDFPAVDEVYLNVARSVISGAELRGSATLLDTQIGFGLNYTDARNDVTGAALARRPKKTARLDLDRRWDKLSYGLTLAVEDKRPDGGAIVPGFGLLNLRAAYAASPSVDLNLSVRNVLERDYTTVSTYNGEPINVLAGLTWKL